MNLNRRTEDVTEIARVSDLLTSGYDKKKLIEEFVALNKIAWSDLVQEDVIWNHENVAAQFKNCPELQYCAFFGGELAATLTTININEEDALACKNWKQMSGDCTLSTHNPNGDSAFGLDLSANPKFSQKRIPDIMMEKAFIISVISSNKKGAFLGSRIPRFHKHHGEMSAEEYVRWRRKGGKPVDPELYLYEKAGFRIIKVIPDYIVDPDSCDYGVLMFWKNPFYKLSKHVPFLSSFFSEASAKLLLNPRELVSA